MADEYVVPFIGAVEDTEQGEDHVWVCPFVGAWAETAEPASGFQVAWARNSNQIIGQGM